MEFDSQADERPLSESPNSDPDVPRPESALPQNPFETLRVRRFLLWLLITSPPALIAFIAIGDAGLPDARKRILGLVAGAIWVYGTMAAWMLVASRKKGIDLRLLAGRGLTAREYALTALMAVPALLAASGFSLSLFAAVSYVLPEEALRRLMDTLALASGKLGAPDLAVAFLVACVVAPPIEEYFFRGFLLNRCTAKWGLRKAIAVTAILFAVIHGFGLGVIFLGFLAALLYVRTRSLAAPMVLHVSSNVIALVMQILTSLNDSGDATTAAEIRTGFVFFGLPGLLIGLSILLVIAKGYWPARDSLPPYMASVMDAQTVSNTA